MTDPQIIIEEPDIIYIEIAKVEEPNIITIERDSEDDISIDEFKEANFKKQIELLKKKIAETKKISGLSEESIKILEEEEKKLSKLYYNEFKERNKDKINEKVDCPICGGNYTYFNKSRHLKTKRCLSVKKLRGL